MQTSSLPEKNLSEDVNVEAFVMHVTSLKLNLMPIHSARKAQIALLVIKKMQNPSEYSDFSDVFLEKVASILTEITKMNQHIIKLQKSQQPLYGPIYSLGPVKLKTLKIYIETNLANSFIRPSKLSANALIFFVGKPNGIFCLWVDYRSLNNFTIKNQYLLPFIAKSLDQLGWKKRFT